VIVRIDNRSATMPLLVGSFRSIILNVNSPFRSERDVGHDLRSN
jgi:hypothetical protein